MGCEDFEIAKHHELLINALTRVEAGTLKRLMVFEPPRHGKTLIASKLFPAFCLGRRPTRNIISGSYGQEFANGLGREVRNLVSSAIHQFAFPESKLSEDSSAQNHFNTTRGGEYNAVGRGGQVTGRGGDIIIIDDPLKGREEAQSTATREKVKAWYRNDIRSRQENKNASIVLIQTRWHVDDLAGYILREHGHETWEIIELPALAIDNADRLGRATGDPLWPSHFDLAMLDAQRRAMTTSEWLSLYQQRPTVGAGYLFKREWLEQHLYDPETAALNWRSMNRCILVDPANSEKKGSDYTYMWVVGASDDHQFYVLDMVRDHFTLQERGNKLFELHRKWALPQHVAYEEYGMQADVAYLNEKMDREAYHFAITPVGGRVSKPERIGRLEPIFREGRVWFPHHIDYTSKEGMREDLVRQFLEEEFVNYVEGGGGVKHDDGLDALSRLFDIDLQFPSPSVLGFAYRTFKQARDRRRRGTSSWSA